MSRVGRSPLAAGRACAPSGLSRDASQAEPLVPNALAKLHDFIDRAGPQATLMVSGPFRDTLRHKSDPHDWQFFPKGRALYRGAFVELHDEWSWGWMVRKADRSFVEAQGIEAQRAETVEQGSVHESPVGKADAPKDSHPDKPGVGG